MASPEKNKRSEESKGAGNADDKKKLRRFRVVFLILTGLLLLSLLVLLSLQIYLFLKGNTDIGPGYIKIPVEIITPSGKKAPPHFSGRLLDVDGKTCKGYILNIKPGNRSVNITENGYFMFDNLGVGVYMITLADGNGKKITDLKINISYHDIAGISIVQNNDGSTDIKLSRDIRLEDLVITYDKKTQKLVFDTNRISYLTKDGLVATPAGTADTGEGVIVTPSGNICLDDRRVILPVVESDGSIWVIMPNDSLKKFTPGSYDGITFKTDGRIILPDGTEIDKDGKITAPGREPATPGETGVIIIDKTVYPIGSIQPNNPSKYPRDIPHLSGRLLDKDRKPLSARLIWEEARQLAAYAAGPLWLKNSPGFTKLLFGGDSSSSTKNLTAAPAYSGIPAVTNNNGYFMLDNINNGEHTLSVVDSVGRKIAGIKLSIVTTSVSGVVITGNQAESYLITSGTDIRLVEIDLIFDRDTGSITVDTSNITFITTGGYVSTPSGSASNKNAVIVTPSGNILMGDGTIILPVVGESGGRTVITPDDVLRVYELGEYGIFKILQYGTVVLPDNATIDKDGRITTPGNAPTTPGETGIFITDGKAYPIGYTPPAPEATAELIVLSGRKAGTGEVIDADTRPFIAENMYPGDSITKYYCLEVTPNGTVRMRFYITLEDPNAKLGEELRVRVTLWESTDDDIFVETGELYDGLMCNMESNVFAYTDSYKQVSAENGVTVRYFYEVTVYLETSVGNSYADQELSANFHWELLK